MFNELKTAHILEAYTEEQLVGLLHRGDHRALAEVVRRYGGMVAKVVKGMLGDVPEAEDVGQETFIRFWNRIDKYRHEAKISTYLVRIAMNLSLNELNRRNKRYGFFGRVNQEHQESLMVHKPTEEEQYSNNQLVEMALSSLDQEHRSVVVLRLIQGFSTKETAEMLGIPAGTVLSRLSRGLEKLRIIIKKTNI